MGKPCENEDGPRLLKLRAWSGEAKDKAVVCNLNGGTDVRHFVKVHNWDTIPIDIELTSKIMTQPDPLAEFHHPSASNVTPVRWEKNFQVPPMNRGLWRKPGEQEFYYVKLSIRLHGGSENIVAEGSVEYDDGTNDTLNVTIRVDT